MPSMYQLMPSPNMPVLFLPNGSPAPLDIYAVETWREQAWGIFDPTHEKGMEKRFFRLHPGAGKNEYGIHQKRLKDHFEIELRRAATFHRALAAAPIPSAVKTTLLGGDCIPTLRALLVEEDQGKPAVRFKISDIRSPPTSGNLEALYFEPGDGTVTKSSLLGAVPAGPAGMVTTSLPDAHAVFICEEHRALVHNATFQDNLLHVLLYQPLCYDRIGGFSMDSFRRSTAVIILVWVSAVLVLLPKSIEAADTLDLTILHTSDLHGQVLPFDDARDSGATGSLARVSAAVAAIRASSGHAVVLVDSGDTLQGSAMEELIHIRRHEPSPVIKAMNLIGYEAMAVGNHEFNFGLGPLRGAEAEAGFPFLAANAIDVETGLPAFRPFVVKEYGRLRVGLLGLVTPNIPGWEEAAHYEGLAFQPMDEAARHWVPILRSDEACDLVIVLAHTGFEVDPRTGETNGTEYENFGDRLARVPGIDLLLTGHAHQDIPPRLLHGTIVSQPSARGRMMTRIDLEMTRGEGGRWSITQWRGENIDLSASEVDGAITAAFDQNHRQVVESLAKPLTIVEAPVSVRDCRIRDCEALDLIHEVQLKASGADLSLASLLTGGTPDLPVGPVTRRWVRSLYIYPNTLRSLKLTGAQVKDLLEHIARYYDGIECPPSGPCVVIVDPDVRHYNIDTMQGLSYRIDPTRPKGDRVRDVRQNGDPLDPGADLTVVCNNYRAAGGGGFPHLAEAEVVWRSSEEVAAMIDEYLSGQETWAPTADGNWVIAPGIEGEKRPSHKED